MQTEYDVLFTVKNNNYFSVELSNIGMRVFYNDALIGYYYSSDSKNNDKDRSESVYIPSHSLIDIMIPITFSPGITQAYTIWTLYQDNNLPLEIDFFADTSTYLFNKNNDIKILDMHLNLQMTDYVIGVNITTDRTDCNCPENLP